MRLPINIIPQEIIDLYNLKELEEGGYIYCDIVKLMYGLPQDGKIYNDLLTSRLNKFVYYPFQYTPGLWLHKWRPILFSLVVDNFGIKCEGIQHGRHLKEALGTYHEVSLYCKGKLFFGVSLDWYYKG